MELTESIKPILKTKWKTFFVEETSKPYFKKLTKTLSSEFKNYQIYPPQKSIFKLFESLEPDDIKVVILGQDPYHQNGQANGIAFSVEKEPVPPSLRNIFKEIKNNYKDVQTNHNLMDWVKQGVFLLNTILTVRDSSPQSHKNIGWLEFTKNLLIYLSQTNQDLVYLLWGNNSKSYKNLINQKSNYILESAHPSPLSASRGFLGNQHFLRTNEFLIRKNIKQINW